MVSGLDFVGIWLMFTHIDSLGGFGLRRDRLPVRRHRPRARRSPTCSSAGRAARPARSGRAASTPCWSARCRCWSQVCADQFALRRLGRIAQAGAGLRVGGCTYVDWTPAKVACSPCSWWSSGVGHLLLAVRRLRVPPVLDRATPARSPTPSPTAATRSPSTRSRSSRASSSQGVTFLLPLAFVNWYPALYLLGRAGPVRPAALAAASPSPLAAACCWPLAAARLARRASATTAPPGAEWRQSIDEP